MSELEEIYERVMGKPPARLPDDHPDKWQWEYRGTKSEREHLRQELGLNDQEDEAPAIIDGQEELFS